MTVPYNDNSAADGDPGHEAVCDGVCLVGVADGVIVAVEASLVRGVHQSQDDEGQRCCKAERGEDWGQQPAGSTSAHSTNHLSSLSPCSPMPGRDFPPRDEVLSQLYPRKKDLKPPVHCPDSDRALSELTEACSTQIPRKTATNGHPQSLYSCLSLPLAQQWQGLILCPLLTLPSLSA